MTNRPHPQFLGSISDPVLLDLNVPSYLYLHHYVNNPIDNMNVHDGSSGVDGLRYYICAALARHHGFRVELVLGRVGAGAEAGAEAMSPYQNAYFAFETHFTAVLHSLLQCEKNDDIKFSHQQQQQQQQQQYRDLISLEQILTHESFALWPELFDHAFRTNVGVLRHLISQTPSLLEVLAVRKHPSQFLREMKNELRREWIELDDAVDILDGRCRQYRAWMTLEEERKKMWGKFARWENRIGKAMRVFGGGEFDGRRGRPVGFCRGGSGGVGARMVGVEMGWRWELEARLRERLERLEMARRQRVRDERRAHLRRETAGGKENVKPVVRRRVDARAEWDPEAYA